MLTPRYFSPLVVLMVLACSVKSTQAIPLFARKYQTPCYTCHTSEPWLNDFGKRFLSHGYQLPGSTADPTPQENNAVLPIALVTHPLVAHERSEDNIYARSTSATSVGSLDLDLFSSTALGEHFSYFSEIAFELDKEESKIDIATMYVLYTDVLGDGSGNLNFRAGKMHLLLPFSSFSMLSNTDPLAYEDPVLREHVSARNGVQIAEPQFALSAFGVLQQMHDGFHWEIAASGGTMNNVKLRDGYALYASFKQVMYVAGSALGIGAFYYGGTQSVVTEGYAAYPRENNHRRVGVDLELYDPWINRIHLYGQYVFGSDDNVDFFGKDRKVTTVLGGLDAILIPEKLYAFWRYDRLRAKDVHDETDRIDVGLRYHVLPNMVATAGLVRTDSRYIRMINLIPVAADFTSTTLTFGILFGY